MALALSLVGAFHRNALAQGAAQGAAQAERITIRTVPAPNQVVVMRGTQDLTMNVEGPPGLPVSGVILGKTNFAGTMRVDPPRAERQTARYTLDRLDVETTFNGAPLPIGNPGRDVVGQTFSITFDGADNIVDVQSTNPILRPLLSAGFFGLPNVALAVGESTTVHRQTPIPLPAMTSLNATVESTYTLRSVTTEPLGRIAHLVISTAGGMEQASGSPLSMTATISGSGTMDVNLDAGYVVRHETTTTFDAAVQPPTSQTAAQPSTLKMHGTMTVKGEAETAR